MESHDIIPSVTQNNESRIALYKHFSLELPFVREAESEQRKDVIHATCSIAASTSSRGYKAAIPAKTSTVLVRVAKRNPSKGPLDGKHRIEVGANGYTYQLLMLGLRAARVRVIFCFPPELGSYPHPLAYVNWYKPFRELGASQSDFAMYQTSISTHQHVVRSCIIPITDIVRSCHLSPSFGRAVDRGWDSYNILDQAPSFYLNPYLRHNDFFFFQHLGNMQEKARRERERFLAYKRSRKV